MVSKMKERKPVIKVEELYREYAKLSQRDGETESIKVLKGLDFAVKEQEFVGIMGKSGCGKTTLLKTLGLIDKPTKGTLYFCGRDTRKLWNDELADIRRRKIGFVFQDFYLMDSLSVSENIMLPMVLDKKDACSCIRRAVWPVPSDEKISLRAFRRGEAESGDQQSVDQRSGSDPGG